MGYICAMDMSNIDTLREVSQDQRGLVTTAQALELGVSRKRLSEFVADGRVDRVRQGLYLVVPAPEDEHRELRIAWILLDPTRFGWDRLDDAVPTGVVSHRSAARMQRLGDLDADITELSTTRRIRLRLSHTRLRTANLTNEDWTVLDGLPVTTAVRTVADLAAVGTDAGHLAGVVLDALVADYTTMTDVAAALDEYALSYGYRSGDEFATALVRIAGVPRNIHALAEVDRPVPATPITRPSDLAAQALAGKIFAGLPKYELPEGFLGLLPKYELPEELRLKYQFPEGLFPKYELPEGLLAGLLKPDLLGPAISNLTASPGSDIFPSAARESLDAGRPHNDEQQDEQQEDDSPPMESRGPGSGHDKGSSQRW